jgi:hypothetical protein
MSQRDWMLALALTTAISADASFSAEQTTESVEVRVGAKAAITSAPAALLAPRNRVRFRQGTTMPLQLYPGVGTRLRDPNTTRPKLNIGPFAPRNGHEYDEEGYPYPRIRLIRG